MNENYKWKGTSFNSKGIIIEETPIIPKPMHSYTKYTIPGKSGYLSIDNKTYEPITYSMKCHLNTKNANMDEIRAWLDGYGELQIDSNKVYTGYISNSISFEKVMNFRKFIIQFMLQPIARATSATTVVATQSTTFNSASLTNTYPTITVIATGTVIIDLNNVSFTIYDADGTYVLDCNAKEITKNNVNQSSNMSGDFPYVIPGSNSISITGTGTVTSATISYYKTFL